MTAAQGVKDYIGPLKFGDWQVGQMQWNRVKKVLFGNVPNFAFIGYCCAIRNSLNSFFGSIYRLSLVGAMCATRKNVFSTKKMKEKLDQINT